MTPSPLNGLKHVVRGPDPQTSPIHLTRKNIYLLPSKFGYLYLLTFLGMLLGAVNYANNLAYAMAFMTASLGLVSVLHTFRNLAGLSIVPSPPNPVFAGQNASFELLIEESRGRRRFSLFLKKSGMTFPIPRISPLATTAGRILLSTEHRGLVRLERFSLKTTYPLGLVTAWSRCNLQTTALVYPPPSARTSIPVAGRHDPGALDVPREYLSGLEDFQDLKDYRPGESYKRIYWKSYAREQGLQVKRFASGSSRTVWLDFQAVPETDPETRLSILCAQVLEAHKGQIRYGLLLPGQTIHPGTGLKHRHTCLSALALFEVP